MPLFSQESLQQILTESAAITSDGSDFFDRVFQSDGIEPPSSPIRGDPVISAITGNLGLSAIDDKEEEEEDLSDTESVLTLPPSKLSHEDQAFYRQFEQDIALEFGVRDHIRWLPQEERLA